MIKNSQKCNYRNIRNEIQTVLKCGDPHSKPTGHPTTHRWQSILSDFYTKLHQICKIFSLSSLFTAALILWMWAKSCDQSNDFPCQNVPWSKNFADATKYNPDFFLHLQWIFEILLLLFPSLLHIRHFCLEKYFPKAQKLAHLNTILSTCHSALKMTWNFHNKNHNVSSPTHNYYCWPRQAEHYHISPLFQCS